MNVLIICNRIPFPLTTNAFSYRVLNGIKYLANKYSHRITLVAFEYKGDSAEYISKYCENIVTIETPSSKIGRMLYYASISLQRPIDRIISRRNLFNFTYSQELSKIVGNLVETEKFDIIFVAEPSLCSYVFDLPIPKILETWSASLGYKEARRREGSLLKKLYYHLNYLMMRSYEKEYWKFDMCLVPTGYERTSLNSYVPKLNISVIPFGIDTDVGIVDTNEDFPSILFLGSLNSIYNQQSLLYLYNEIYPIVKNKVPKIKLYIVGKEPPDNIAQLPLHDPSIIVTGYVKDVRPYLAKASIVVLPVHGFGIKTRILEAMAMGKPVITSSEGIHGIDVTPGEDILIANSIEEFAMQTIDILSNEALRTRIGINAKKLMKDKYSWERMTDDLNDLFREIASK